MVSKLKSAKAFDLIVAMYRTPVQPWQELGTNYLQYNIMHFVLNTISVCKQHPLSKNFNVLQIVVDIPSDSSEDFEEFEDASESFTVDDEMFVDDVASKKLQPLRKLFSIS